MHIELFTFKVYNSFLERCVSMNRFNNINIENLKKHKHIHMIGIGGISMSGIAEILHNWGIFVTGSDITRSKITDKLGSHGIYVTIGHDTNLVKKADLIVFSAAVKQDDPELVVARNENITIVERSDFVRIYNKNL